MDSEQKEKVITITAKTAIYLFQTITKFVKDGFGGDPFDDGSDYPGLIDEVPMDSEGYRFFSEVLGFIRMIAGILRHELDEQGLLEHGDEQV